MSSIMQKMRQWFADLRRDFRSYDKSNTAIEPVLQSRFFSCYRGSTVLRTNRARSGSFGIIFLKRALNDLPLPEAADELRHEYGHILQLRQLGLLRFALCIGFASWRMWGSDSYYEKPWEITADLLGGVESRIHQSEALEAGLRYLEQSKCLGPLVWKTIR